MSAWDHYNAAISVAEDDWNMAYSDALSIHTGALADADDAYLLELDPYETDVSTAEGDVMQAESGVAAIEQYLTSELAARAAAYAAALATFEAGVADAMDDLDAAYAIARDVYDTAMEEPNADREDAGDAALAIFAAAMQNAHGDYENSEAAAWSGYQSEVASIETALAAAEANIIADFNADDDVITALAAWETAEANAWDVYTAALANLPGSPQVQARMGAPEAPEFVGLNRGERQIGDPEEARLRAWRFGRTETWTGNFNWVRNGNNVSFSATVNWFFDDDSQTMLSHVATIRDAIESILADLANYRVGHGAANEIEQRVDRWFGNGNGLTAAQLQAVRRVFTQVRDGIDNNTTVYWDDSRTISWYGQVNWTWFSGRYGTIQLGQDYFAGNDRDIQIGTLIHELTHLYAFTADHGYFGANHLADPLAYTKEGQAVNLTTAQLINNADSFAGFLVQYYS